MLDNATNNDTMVQGLERCAHDEGIAFNADWARLRCLPHIIHLAAVKACPHLFLYVFYLILQ